MKDFYNKYFFIPKDGKISEKAMIVRMVTTIAVIVLCLFAMSLSAYAYFSHNVSSGSCVIKSADFSLNATVDTQTSDDGCYLLKRGEYAVILTKTGTASTGFCIVEITIGENTVKYYTQQLGTDGENQRMQLQFTLDLTELPDSDWAKVKFTPHWGTSYLYGYDNVDGNELFIHDMSCVKVSTAANIILQDDSAKKEN